MISLTVKVASDKLRNLYRSGAPESAIDKLIREFNDADSKSRTRTAISKGRL